MATEHRRSPSPALHWLLTLLTLVFMFACGKADKSSRADDKKADYKKDDGGDYATAMSQEDGEARKGKDKDGKDEAGPKGWKRSVLNTHKVRIEVGDDETLPVDVLDIHARVDGFRARVLIDVDFHNPNNWALEGSFSLRLPEGASPYFLAFGGRAETAKLPEPSPEADGQASFTPEGIMAAREQVWADPKLAKQAIMVERDRAKVAYRNTVQRNVDPALSEWAGAGVFNTRLFPIQPNAKHRVVIGYDVDLLEASDGWLLPVIVPDDAATRSLDLVVVAAKGAKVSLTEYLAQDPAQERTLEAVDAGPGKLRYRLQDPPVQLELALRGSTSAALYGREPGGTQDFFAARGTPELPKQKARGGSSRAVFAVDVSMSSNPEKFNVWLDVLRATLDQNRDELKQFAVLFFNVEQFWWAPAFSDNTPEQVEALMAFTETLALEGATDLGAALREATGPGWAGPEPSPEPSAGGQEEQAGVTQKADWDLFLLSDGAATWGEPDQERVIRELAARLDGRLFGYRTGLSGTELSVLNRLARETGGAVFAVTGPDQVAAAATAHRSVPWELLSIRAAGVDDLLVAGAPRYLYPGQTLAVAGRLAAAANGEAGLRPKALELTLSQAGQGRTAKVRLPPAIESELAPRAYGQLAVSALDRFHGLTSGAQDHGVDTLAYSRHFRVTGRAASLLMLDSDDDYANAGIDPVLTARRDAEIVAREAATAQLELAERNLASRLGDPRVAMIGTLARVRRLSSPDAQLDPDSQGGALASLEGIIRQLPDAAFEVEIPPLVCARHDRAAIDAGLLTQLQTRELVYDELVAAAELRRSQVSAADGLKALSSLVEASPGNTVMARDVAFTAREWGLGSQVYQLLQRVAATRPEEPQTYLALGALAAELGAPDLAMIYYELALSGGWEQRFGDVRQIAAIEYLRFLSTTAPERLANPELARQRRSALSEQLPVETADLLVIMTWNTDNTDIDLHVLEPSGEDCHYANRTTRAGGQMSVDVTQGFGPEMYYIPKLQQGDYEIQAHYFASDRGRLSTRTKAYVTVFRDFGTPSQSSHTKVVSLEDGKSTHHILTVNK